MSHEQAMREYANKAECMFLVLLEEVMKHCPESFDPDDKTRAIGTLSDLRADLFNDCIEHARFRDQCISGARLLKHGMSEGRAA